MFSSIPPLGAEQELRRFRRIIRDHRPWIDVWVKAYEDIHQHPELSLFESRTSSVVAEHMRRIGLQVTTGIGGHGVAGILRNGPGKTILVRAELDALPIEERTGLPYASTVRAKDWMGQEQPVMHACGHDIHMACLLASLKLLRSASREWLGTMLAISQPNEEIPGGARAMVEDGLYEVLPRPDVMLAQHVGMSKAGLVAVRTGPVLPASDCIEIDMSSEGPSPNNLNPPKCPEPVSLASYQASEPTSA